VAEHEVVIAGGGPTGLMLGGELALTGVDAAIVDPRPPRSSPGLVRAASMPSAARGPVPRYAPDKEAPVNHVSEILGDKGRDVLKIDAEASALDAVRQMVGANIGSLLVTDGDEVTGIVTERDYLRRVAQEGPTDDSVTVRDIMSSPLIVVSPNTEIDECMAVMTDRRIRHLPVVENGDVVGIVSIGDVVKFKSKQQSFEIRYLTDYITSG
jgi:CBS domain-containing protein